MKIFRLNRSDVEGYKVPREEQGRPIKKSIRVEIIKRARDDG